MTRQVKEGEKRKATTAQGGENKKRIKAVIYPSLFPAAVLKGSKEVRVALNDDVESIILAHAGIESVVTLSLLSRAAYEYIRTRPTENNSLLPSMLQAHFKQKRGGRALPVVPASFSERPFEVIKGLLSQSEMRSSCSLKGHTDWVLAMSFSPDGRYFVSASDDHTCRVWTQDDEGQWRSS